MLYLTWSVVLPAQDKMPHFYRYRVEDNLGIESRGLTTPAATSPAVTRRETAGPVAHVKLLGCEAVIAVPEVGAETNQRNTNFLFTQLENTIKDLKDENKQMRKDDSMFQDSNDFKIFNHKIFTLFNIEVF